MAGKKICDCWDEADSLTDSSSLLREDLDIGKWKRAHDTLSTVKEKLELLERCSGMELPGIKRRIRDIEEEMKEYKQFAAMIDADSIKTDLVWDVAKCPKRKYKLY